jgi:hypothetical protein
MVLPLDVTDEYWVFYGKSYETTGKWMLFIENKELNYRWMECLYLFETGLLPGIVSMKCSTAKTNTRSNNVDKGVIIMYMNSHDEKYILNVGKNIIYQTKYNPPNQSMAYKTNEQTQSGTRATGNRKNNTYLLSTK